MVAFDQATTLRLPGPIVDFGGKWTISLKSACHFIFDSKTRRSFLKVAMREEK